MEEFQEADILWPHDGRYDVAAATVPWHGWHGAPRKPTGPIKIPAKAQANFMDDDDISDTEFSYVLGIPT
ncbi:hypothetical protein C4D60_Mb01t15100 [Musa balbisiana]|uniref:Uncharacterized protein n=1 Tax=Musa balbisiana TaxID=52838 RepID=A0A4S8JPE2_MUSBA|nr:hypothetical protein C4D60_Mb01t15100 [Musa balbisiana]